MMWATNRSEDAGTDVIRTYPVRYCYRASARWRSSCYCEWCQCSIWFVASHKAYCIIKKRTCQPEIVNNLREFDSCIDNYLVYDVMYYALLQCIYKWFPLQSTVFVLAAWKLADMMTSYFHWKYISFMRFSKTLTSCTSSGKNAYSPASCDLQQ